MVLMEKCKPSKKEQCKALMNEIFGPACAALVDNMTEDDCVEKCKEKIRVLLGKRLLKKFDEIE